MHGKTFLIEIMNKSFMNIQCNPQYFIFSNYVISQINSETLNSEKKYDFQKSLKWYFLRKFIFFTEC